MDIIFKKTKNGRIFKCAKCDNIHVEFMVLSLSLPLKKFKQFSRNIIAIDGNDFDKNVSSFKRRNIIIPLNQSNTFSIQLSNEELEELKSLVEQIWVKKEHYA